MALTPGSRLGPYEIAGKLGEGGMGAVFRARDTKLNRDVALKVLPDSFANDPDRLARFTREAQTLASLNHPNIAAIYGIEDSAGVRALVMELVEGQDLSAVIAAAAPRGLDIPDTLAIARQIAEALEAAHEQGIVHRDLKPGNVKVRADGTVKVLDFGLAKAIGPDSASASSELMNSPTITSPAFTQAGIILGTAAYMAPEQAKGKFVDRRADVWAFGVVLYEMLTGRRAFAGEDISDTLVSVLRDDPDWSALPADLPASMRQVLRICLQKDPRKRVRDMSAVRLALDGAFDTPSGQMTAVLTPVVPPRARWLTVLPWAVGAFVVGGLAAAAALWPRPVPAPRMVRFTIPSPPDVPFRTVAASNGIAISPDGSRLVFKIIPDVTSASSAILYERELSRPEAVRLAGTEGATTFFFSPDGAWIAFSSGVDNTLKRIPAGGGPVQTICAIDGVLRGGSWGSDDRIVFATTTSKGLLRVPASGGTPEVLTKVDHAGGEADQFWPLVLPGAKAIVYTAWNGSSSQDTARLVALSLASGKKTDIAKGAAIAQWVPGYLVYASGGGALRAMPFDAENLRPTGDAVPVLDGVAGGTTQIANFGIAQNGTLFYVTGSATYVPPRTMVWVDRNGKQEAITVPPRAYTYARLSPDGTRVALDSRDAQNDIWVWDLARQTLQRLTTDPGLNRMPVWSPDGKRIAFTAERNGLESVYWQNADGSGAPERLSVGTLTEGPESFTPDGTRLLVNTPLGAPFDIEMVTLGATPHEDVLLNSKFSEAGAVVSPDGRWMAYESDETGRLEIYVAPFPNVTASKQPVSTSGGSRPLWSRDGRELFYYNTPDTIMAVPVTPGPTLVLGKPAAVVKGAYARPLNAGRHYDVSPDGKRFLMLVDAPAPDGQKPVAQEMTVVLNWAEELRAKLPK